MDVEFRVEAVGFVGKEQTPTVMLRERDGERFLRLGMGAAEMYAVAQVIMNITSDRPSTHDLLAAFVREVHVEPISVRLEPWRGDVFRGTFTGVQDGRTLCLDCRPSDAVALALRMRVPILAAPALVRLHALHEVYKSPDTQLLRLEDLDPANFGQYVM